MLKQEETLSVLERFLGFPLVKIPVRLNSIGRWETDEGFHDFPIFTEDLIEQGYETIQNLEFKML